MPDDESRAARDEEYSNAAHIPGGSSYPARWAAQAGAFRAGADAKLGIAYGDGIRQRLDLFLPERPPHGLLVFVHGGYWLAFGREDWSHLAAGAVTRGWAIAIPSYTLAPAARLSAMRDEIAAAVTCAADQVAGPIVLAGHSAGAQLVARMLAPGVLPDAVAARLARVVPISPVADLRPLRETSMQSDLRLSEEEAATESPLLMRDRLPVEVEIVVGAEERPVFLRDARDLAEAWGARRTVLDARHHFDAIDWLADPDHPVLRRLCPN